MRTTAVIPCYNGERYIGKAIEHILDQTRPADEVIVIDDGSTDNSLEVIEKFKNIKVIKHPVNLGLPTGRNNAWKAATGDIIIYVDVDAYSDRYFIEKILEEYSQDEIGAVGGAGFEVFDDTASDRWRKNFLNQNHGQEKRVDVKFLFGIGASFRKTALENVGGFDPMFRTNGEDVDVCLRLKQAGYKLVYTPHAKLHHHRRDNLKSLLKMIHRWWFWGHLAHMKNRIPYLKDHIAETLKMTRYTLKKSLAMKDWKLLVISILVFVVSMEAIFEAEFKGPGILITGDRNES